MTQTKAAVDPVESQQELNTLGQASYDSSMESAAKKLDDLLTCELATSGESFDPVWLYPYFLQYKSTDHLVDDTAFMEAINCPPGSYIRPLVALLKKSPTVNSQGQQPIVHLAHIISQSANDNNCQTIATNINNFFIQHNSLVIARSEPIKIEDDLWRQTCASIEPLLQVDTKLQQAYFKTNTFSLLYSLHRTLADKHPDISSIDTDDDDFHQMALRYNQKTMSKLIVNYFFIDAKNMMFSPGEAMLALAHLNHFTVLIGGSEDRKYAC